MSVSPIRAPGGPRDESTRRWLGASYLDLLLLTIPAAVAVRYVPGWENDTWLFVLAGIGILPLAAWMGRATEQLGRRAGEGVGGLLNATFGNAAELIIALAALRQGLTSLVKASVTGSIIGNLLFVLGLATLSGGLRFRRQTFNKTAARVSTTSLTLASIGLLVPTIFHVAAARLRGWTPLSEQRLSLAIGTVLLVTYGLSLVFSLVTHRELFRGQDPAAAGEEEEEAWSYGLSILVLGVATALLALLSEFLVGSINSAQARFGLTERFIGIIVVAIIGNAAEHSTAVWMALKNKMDLTLGVAVGSSLQVALFVTPVLLFASHWFGRPMTLEFTLPEVAVVALAVWIVGEISGDGESNWLEGVQLLSVYLIVATLFFFLPDGAPVSAGQPSANAAVVNNP